MKNGRISFDYHFLAVNDDNGLWTNYRACNHLNRKVAVTTTKEEGIALVRRQLAEGQVLALVVLYNERDETVWTHQTDVRR